MDSLKSPWVVSFEKSATGDEPAILAVAMALEVVPVSERRVPDALSLVVVDREHDHAVYREENLWMQHR